MKEAHGIDIEQEGTRRKLLLERVHSKAPEWHPVGDEVLKKIRDRR